VTVELLLVVLIATMKLETRSIENNLVKSRIAVIHPSWRRMHSFVTVTWAGSRTMRNV